MSLLSTNIHRIVFRLMKKIPKRSISKKQSEFESPAPWRIYNVSSSKPKKLKLFIQEIENQYPGSKIQENCKFMKTSDDVILCSTCYYKADTLYAASIFLQKWFVVLIQFLAAPPMTCS